jgi:hypothetical protein
VLYYNSINSKYVCDDIIINTLDYIPQNTIGVPENSDFIYCVRHHEYISNFYFSNDPFLILEKPNVIQGSTFLVRNGHYDFYTTTCGF